MLSNFWKNSTVEHLIRQWAPLIWLSPDEKYMPLNIEEFLSNVDLRNDKGQTLHTTVDRKFPNIKSKSLYLVTKKPIEFLKNVTGSFLHGTNPKENSVPVYAVVTHCPSEYYAPIGDQMRNEIGTIGNSLQNQHLFFHVTYWLFYPYNEGKEVCFIGNMFWFST